MQCRRTLDIPSRLSSRCVARFVVVVVVPVVVALLLLFLLLLPCVRLTFTIFNIAVHWGKIKDAVAVAVAVAVGNRSCKFLLPLLLPSPLPIPTIPC